MSTAQDITARFQHESRHTLEVMRKKIVNCLAQLSDEDVNWRAFEGANSVANLVTHLCGNVGQWIIAGVGGDALNRNRPAEFAQDLRAARDALVEKLNATIRRADEVIAAVTSETILSPRTIQGYDQTVMGAIFHAVTHFEGHAHQIVYITRSRLGARYQFHWEPKTAAQMSRPV
jgi:uncharacterized damage-inducible protein DinB